MSATFSYRRAVFAAALIIGVSATLAALAPTYISTEWSHRLLGVLLGAVVVVYSNSIPKILTSRSLASYTPADEQAARRFAGWSLVLGGLGYMGASLFAPIGMANLVGAGLLGTGTLLAVIRCLSLGTSSSRS